MTGLFEVSYYLFLVGAYWHSGKSRHMEALQRATASVDSHFHRVDQHRGTTCGMQAHVKSAAESLGGVGGSFERKFIVCFRRR